MTRTRALASLPLALAFGVAGCMAGMAGMAGHAAHAPPPTAAPPAADAASGGMGDMTMQACPMAVPGAQVAAADTLDGESIMFTTSPDRAADLRARVHAMADMHNRHHQGGEMEGMRDGMQHGGMIMGHGSTAASVPGAHHMEMMPPPSHAIVEDIDNGARVVVTPNNPADLERLRSAVRMHAEHMRESGTCEMGRSGKM
jgi:hypothetical protein